MSKRIYAPIKVGSRYSFLTVIGFDHAGEGKDKHKYWRCLCDCGKETVVRDNSLKSGATKSCGHYVHTTPNRVGKHSAPRPKKPNARTRERLYVIYNAMKSRCKEGGEYWHKGIRVCDEWERDYESFKSWSFDNGYDPSAKYTDCTIDRIDNDGDYCPENCRWTTWKVQTRNKSSNRWYVVDGEKMILPDIARKYDISPSTLEQRIKNGVPIEEAILKIDRRRLRNGANINTRC